MGHLLVVLVCEHDRRGMVGSFGVEISSLILVGDDLFDLAFVFSSPIRRVDRVTLLDGGTALGFDIRHVEASANSLLLKRSLETGLFEQAKFVVDVSGQDPVRYCTGGSFSGGRGLISEILPFLWC